MGQTITVIQLHYRKVICNKCGIRNEYSDFLAPYSHVTKRFSQYIFSLCQQMTVYDVTKLVKLNWQLLTMRNLKYNTAIWIYQI